MNVIIAEPNRLLQRAWQNHLVRSHIDVQWCFRIATAESMLEQTPVCHELVCRENLLQVPAEAEALSRIHRSHPSLAIVFLVDQVPLPEMFIAFQGQWGLKGVIPVHCGKRNLRARMKQFAN